MSYNEAQNTLKFSSEFLFTFFTLQTLVNIYSSSPQASLVCGMCINAGWGQVLKVIRIPFVGQGNSLHSTFLILDICQLIL